MGRWSLDEPGSVSLEKLDQIKVRIVAGHVDVLASDEAPRLELSGVEGPPLVVSQEGGSLTVTYEDLTWEGLSQWLRPRPRSHFQRRCLLTITVPAQCAVEAETVSAGMVISGIGATTRVRSVSGDSILDSVDGEVRVQSVTGQLEARELTGRLSFNTAQGGLTVAGGRIERLDAKTITGRITADIDLTEHCRLELATVSGPITLRVGDEPGAFVELKSTSGRLDTSFENFTSGDRPGPATTLDGRIGYGTGSVTAVTINGDITLLRRGVDSEHPAEETA